MTSEMQEKNKAANTPIGTPTAHPPLSARILKKRETDRKCQRMLRERTKSRIGYLEGLVEQFQKQDSTGRVEALLTQLAEAQAERDQLAKKVKGIEGIIKDERDIKRENEDHSAFSTTPDASVDISDSRSGISALDKSISVRRQPRQQETRTDLSTSISPLDNNTIVGHQCVPQETRPAYRLFNADYQNNAHTLESAWIGSEPPHLPHVASGNECMACQPQPPGQAADRQNLWGYANATLTQWFKWPPQKQSMPAVNDNFEDVPIRAIVDGWGAVEARMNAHPLWDILRDCVSTVLWRSGQLEQMAILRQVGLLLRAHMNPTTEEHKRIPHYYLKRPTDNVLRAYAIEYFPWPGMRERLGTSEHRYCNNYFWTVFNRNLRIQWPFELRDCYTRNVETGLYKISPHFEERVSDIGCWRMEPDFFKIYPELMSVIPITNTIPASMSLKLSPRRSSRASDAFSNGISDVTSEENVSHHGATPNSVDQMIEFGKMTQGVENWASIPVSDIPTYTYPMHDHTRYSSFSGVVPVMNGWDYNDGSSYFYMNNEEAIQAVEGNKMYG